MIGAQDMLPMRPGYALGGIINKDEMKIAILTKERDAQQEELLDVANRKEKLKLDKADAQSKGSTELAGALQKQISEEADHFIRIEGKIESIHLQLKTLRDKIGQFDFVESLSLEERDFSVIYTSFSSERKNELEIESGDIEGQIKKFVADLFLKDSPHSYLPPGAIEGLTSKVRSICETTRKVVVVGSVITLPRVKVLDPIRVRKGTVSRKLQENAHNYYVLAEAVLGGVFIGVTYDESFKELGVELDSSSLEARYGRLSLVSYISQGAIPRTNRGIEGQIGLKDVMDSWKEELLTNEHSGYPIGFKVRELTDVFEENSIALTPND